MSDMCKCCGKVEAVPAEALEMRARFKTFNFEEMPEEVRQSVPPDILSPMLEGMLNPPEIRKGFCSMCGRAGCDGKTACKVPVEQWKLIDEQVTMANAWASARNVDMFKWREEQQAIVRNAMKGKSTGQWEQLKEGYWRKVVETQAGNMIAEVLKVDFLVGGEYLSEVTLVDATDQQHEGAGMGKQGGLSLEEAKAVCDEMTEEMEIEGPGVYSFIVAHTDHGEFEGHRNSPPMPDETARN